MSNHETLHPSYIKYVDEWIKNIDLYSGDVKREKSTKYLPMPDVISASSAGLNGEQQNALRRLKENAKSRYDNHILPNAVFYNFIEPTVSVAVAAINRKEPVVEVDSRMEYIKEDADGMGMSLSQLCRQINERQYVTGRIGVLVKAPESGTLQENTSGEKAPRFKLYPEISIINWDTKTVKSREVLSLLVLKQQYKSTLNVFSHETQTEYIVYELTPDGVVWSVYRDGVVYESDYEMWNGGVAQKIPFVFIGSNDNDPDVDLPPITTLAALCHDYYKLNADYREYLRMGADIKYCVNAGTHDTSAEFYSRHNPLGFTAGSGGVPLITLGGSLTAVGAPANTAIPMRLNEIIEMSQKVGASLIESSSSTKTATQSAFDNSISTSKMQAVRDCCETGVYEALKIAHLIMGYPVDNLAFEMTRELVVSKADANMLTALLNSLKNGGLTRKDYFDRLVSLGEISDDVDFDEWSVRLDDESAQSMMLVTQNL
jgi:hypothetical protein